MRTKTIPSIFLSSIVFLLFVPPVLAGVSDQLQQADNLFKNKQYDQAEQIYLSIAQQNIPEAFAAQKNLIILYITTNKLPQADTSYKQLLTRFAGHNDMAQTIYDIARKYGDINKNDKALELYKYNVEHFPDDIYAMWSQVEIIYSHIRKADDAAADTAVSNLLTVFSNQPTLPKEIWQVAKKYDEFQKYDKAFQLNQYNIEHFTNDVHAVLSQVEIVKFYFRKGDDAAVDAVVSSFLKVFSGQPTLPKGLYHIARRYDEFKRFDKAIQLHQYNVDHFHDDIYAMWSQVEIIFAHIRDANYAAANTAVDSFLTVFAGQPTLPKEIYQVGCRYDQAGKSDKALQLHRYNISHFSEDVHAMWSQVEIVKAYIRDGDPCALEAAEASTDSLIANFRNHPNLTEALFSVGEQYYYKAFQREKEGLAAEAKDYFKKALTVWEKAITQSSTSALTPYAYYFSGYCHSRLGEYAKAMEYYQKVADNWPNFEYASDSQLRVARCYDMLAASGQISKSLAAKQIRQACEKLLANHPGSKGADEARGLLGRWTLIENTQ